MKKLLRSISFVFALAASAAIVLHAAHVDVAHAQNTAHHCDLCHVPQCVPLDTVVVTAPTFVVTAETVVALHVNVSPRLRGLALSRGPPSLV